MRTFEEVWQDIKKLEGEDIFTLCRPCKNHILKVDEKGILRYSDCGKGADTFISKRKFENVWKKLTGNGYCRVAAGWKIACVCIARLPEVEYSLNPGAIWLSENKHEFGKLVERTL